MRPLFLLITDILKDAPITLRTMIKKAFDESASLKWPPKADELRALTEDLRNFLSSLMWCSRNKIQNQRNVKRRDV